MPTKQKPGSTESGSSQTPARGSTSIPLSQVLKAEIGQRLQTPDGKAEMRQIGSKLGFAMTEHFHRVLVKALEQAGGDTDLAYRSLLKAFERPPQ